MTTGGPQDQFTRLKSLFPRAWIGDSTPLLDALLRAFAGAFAWLFGLIAFAQAQTRLATATDGWLDAFAGDFFGTTLQRGAGEADEAYRGRIAITLFRERATRLAVVRAVTDLTGNPPDFFEPERMQDCGGGYNQGAVSYSVAGRWGSSQLHHQAFVTVARTTKVGNPLIAGYNISTGGYGQASRAAWSSLASFAPAYSDAQLYAAIDRVKSAGTILWVRIYDGPPGLLGSLHFAAPQDAFLINGIPLMVGHNFINLL